MAGSEFNVDCDRNAIVGGGKYSWNGQILSLRFSILTRKGIVEQAKPTLAFRIRPGGNTVIAERNGERFAWTRSL